jgi:hypothetical protein
MIAAYNAEEEAIEPVAPPPVAPGTLADPGQPVAMAPASLSGAWRDAEGGNYRLVQQGDQIAFQGLSPHGPVLGRGMLRGGQLVLEYAIGGYPYQAALNLSPDGLILAGQYHDPATGESGQVYLQRVQ